MYETTGMIPAGSSLLGRVINSKGAPVDGKGPLADTTLISLLGLTAETGKRRKANRMFEIGIKVIDLLAPMAEGGMNGLFADTGLGKQVITEEIAQHIRSHYSQCALVCLSMDESSYETSELMQVIHEGGLESNMVMVFEQAATSVTAQQMIQAGITIAAHFQAQGYTALLIADGQVTKHSASTGLDAFKIPAAQQTVTTLLLGTGDDYSRYQHSGLLDIFDGYILCNRELSKRRIYPAIDPLQSGSRLLDEGLVSPAYRSVVQQVRQLLERYYELRKLVDTRGEDDLAAEDQQTFKRGQRVEQFLTQPFVVAEPYTDIPGEYVSLDETIRDFEALLSDQHNDVPEQQFWMVGTIEQALAKG